MNIRITSRKFRAKDSLKSLIHKSVNSLEKFSDDIIEAEVVLHFTHMKDSIKTVEILLKVPGKTLAVSESSEEFEKSVGSAVSKLERQLKKVKTKRMAKVR